MGRSRESATVACFSTAMANLGRFGGWLIAPAGCSIPNAFIELTLTAGRKIARRRCRCRRPRRSSDHTRTPSPSSAPVREWQPVRRAVPAFRGAPTGKTARFAGCRGVCLETPVLDAACAADANPLSIIARAMTRATPHTDSRYARRLNAQQHAPAGIPMGGCDVRRLAPSFEEDRPWTNGCNRQHAVLNPRISGESRPD